MGVTSDVLPLTAVDDYADTMLAQRISQLVGIGQVLMGGEQKPAIRVQIDSPRLAASGLSLEDVRGVLETCHDRLAQGQPHDNYPQFHDLRQ